MARLIIVSLLMLVFVSCARPLAPVVDRSPSRGHTVPKHYSTSASRAVNAKGFYQVQPGDTLISIAWKFGMDYRVLASINGIRSPYSIYTKQRLRLKGSAPRLRGTNKKPSSRKVDKSKEKSKGKARTRTTKSTSAGNSKKVKWMWPVRGRMVQSFSRHDRNRQGVKLSGRYGQPILAAEAGRVMYAGSGILGYGKLIIIIHNNNYLSAYGLNRKMLVREGEKVTRGERIAEMGETKEGQPMLHFEVRYANGTPVDPVRLLPRRR